MTGQRREVEALYRLHGADLFRFLVRYTGDTELAADALQDTFRRLLERPPRDRDSLRGWLWRVAVNRIRDLRRTRSRRLRLTDEAAARRLQSDPPPPPDRALAHVSAHATARTVLDALSERDRTLILMREDGFTHREMAETVGTTTGSVGTMLARALKRATEILETHAPTEEAPCR